MGKRVVNDTSLVSVADAIRAKGGTSDALTFPGGFAAAISAIATGGSSEGLAIKRGTVTLDESYTKLNIEHGCGKLPFAFFAYNANLQKVGILNAGCIWIRDGFALTARGAAAKYVESGVYGYYVPLDEPVDYSPNVDEVRAYLNPAAKWNPGTYHWVAIYEV